MDSHSKIIASVIVGLALGAALGLLLFSLIHEEDDNNLQSGRNSNVGATFADDWSDVNDSLGG